MKIIELRFKNLNSLYGEWCIDFSNPEYISSGLFALTGATGAGKSTILDAICLALYGATPRLGKITKNNNEIMSRSTAECYAEVLFESQAGCFRCHFSHHRARKKVDGDLQTPRHEVAEGTKDGKVIENQLRRVAIVIEEKTGMDFERFTRSMLLAQGGFDTFLKADIEQKSKLLEQITGTGIYSQISRRVHERLHDEREKLNILQAEISGIVLLEPEQEKEIEKELIAKQKEVVTVTGKLIKAEKAIAWLNCVNRLRKEISCLAEESVKLQANIVAFNPQRQILVLAQKAATLAGVYATLVATRKQQEDDCLALQNAKMNFPKLELAVSNQLKKVVDIEKQVVEAKKKMEIAKPIILKIRSLDQKLVAERKAIAELEKSCKRDEEQINLTKDACSKEQKKQQKERNFLQLVERYLTENAQDEWLIGGLAGVEQQVNNLQQKQLEIAQNETELKSVVLKLKENDKIFAERIKQCSMRKQELVKVIKKMKQGEKSLAKLLDNRLLREYRTEKEGMLRELAYLKRIEELEDYRIRLEDGKCCPLCGSKEHPFAQGNIPVPDTTEQKIELLTSLINTAEKMETDNKKLEKLEVIARKKLTDSEKLESIAFNDKTATMKRKMELKNNLERLRLGFSESKQALLDKLQHLNISDISATKLSFLLKSLTERMKKWQAQIGEKQKLEAQIALLDGEVKSLMAISETQTKSWSEKQKQLTRLETVYAVGVDERYKLYANKSPDDEEKRLNELIVNAENMEKRARVLYNELQQKLTVVKSQVELLQKNITKRKSELEQLEKGFSIKLKLAEFFSEKQFLDARLSVKQLDALVQMSKKLDAAKIDISVRQKDREIRLKNELAKTLTDKSLAELELWFLEYTEALKQLQQLVATHKHKLSENMVAKERTKEKQSVIVAQKSECCRWEKLHALIGSADGKKYRNFAQGLTFELMVLHANRQLANMNDRYLLVRDIQQPLELNVIDNYQAGEIRSTKNLSGGESFIVSLSLALGLSKMASQKVRVDSLFLDEGFGTLDEDALEVALETLAGLQQDGKLIGIISHVSALKERIATQIIVTPISGGRSKIVGPGCNKIA